MTATPDRPLWQKALLPQSYQELGWAWITISTTITLFGVLLSLVIRLELFASGLQVLDDASTYQNLAARHRTLSTIFGLMPFIIGGILNILLPARTNSDLLPVRWLAIAALWLFIATTATYILVSILALTVKNGGWTLYLPKSASEPSGMFSLFYNTLLIQTIFAVFVSQLLSLFHTAISLALGVKRSSRPIALAVFTFALVVNAIWMMLLLHPTFVEVANYYHPPLNAPQSTLGIYKFATNNYEYVYIQIGISSLIIPATMSYLVLIFGNLTSPPKLNTKRLLIWGACILITAHICLKIPLIAFWLNLSLLVVVQISIMRDRFYKLSWIWLATLPVMFGLFIINSNYSSLQLKALDETSYVVASHHYGIIALGIILALAFFCFQINQRSNRLATRLLVSLHFWVTFTGFNMTFFPQFFLGKSGMPRNYSDYPDAFEFWNKVSSIGAFVTVTGLLILVAAAIYAKKHGGADQKSEANIFS